MDGEVSYIVGLGGSAGVGFEEGIDDFLAGLEGAGGVKGKISTIVKTRGILDKDGLLYLGYLEKRDNSWMDSRSWKHEMNESRERKRHISYLMHFDTPYFDSKEPQSLCTTRAGWYPSFVNKV
jgi:hypothetical protein